MTVVVALVILVGMSLPVPRMYVPTCIQPVIHVRRGMSAPVGMDLLPSLKTRQPD